MAKKIPQHFHLNQDEKLSRPTDIDALEFLDAVHPFLGSAMELSQLIIDAQLAQDKALDVQAIFAIFDQSVATVVKNISVIARNA